MMSKTIYSHIQDNLLKHSWMRDDRHGAITEMLKEKYQTISWDKMKDIGTDWNSYDRVFRLVQNENEELRGQNYDEQRIIREQETEISLGYEVGYDWDKHVSKRR